MTTVSAPGKIFLGGEYAVLLGEEAIVTAINRRAFADYTIQSEKDSSIIVESVMKQTASFFRDKGVDIPYTAWVSVKSEKFRLGKLKIGLGSSAAVAVCAAGAIFEANGFSIKKNLNDILSVAKEAHSNAQQGKGSGADVAVSTMGGTISYRLNETPKPVLLGDIKIAVVFSGRSVSTEEMIHRIDDFKRRDSKSYTSCMSELSAAAKTLAESYKSGNTKDLINASAAYGESMDRLGGCAKINIVTKEHRCAMTLASKLGGAAKPSGAGGGDIAVGFFDSTEALNAFKVQCLRHELTPLNIKTNEQGLRVEK